MFDTNSVAALTGVDAATVRSWMHRAPTFTVGATDGRGIIYSAVEALALLIAGEILAHGLARPHVVLPVAPAAAMSQFEINGLPDFLHYNITIDLPTTMQGADDLDAFVGDTIEGQILARDQMPYARPNVITRHPRIGVAGQLLPARLDGIQHAVGGVRIVGDDLGPYVDQVFIGATCADDRQHD